MKLLKKLIDDVEKVYSVSQEENSTFVYFVYRAILCYRKRKSE